MTNSNSGDFAGSYSLVGLAPPDAKLLGRFCNREDLSFFTHHGSPFRDFMRAR